MGSAVEWLREQNQVKAFRILEAVFCVLTGVLCAEFCVFGYGFFKSLRYVILLWGLLFIAWIDWHSRRIPNRILLFLLGVRCAVLVLEILFYREYGLTLLLSAGQGFLTGGGIFLLFYLVARGSIGAGDVKLFAVLGCYLGGGVIFTAIFLSVLFSAAFSILMLLLKKFGLREEVPLAPFVLAGTIAVMVLGM